MRLEREYASAMENLDQAIDNLPDLPRWVKRLPAKLYTYAKLLFEYLFLHREYAQLLVLREKIIQSLEAKFVFQFEQRLRASIAELCSQMISSLEETRADLSALHAKFQRLTDHFREQTPDPIPGSSTLPLPSVVRLSPFRIHLVTPALLQWAHLHRTMGSAEVRRELLEGDLLLDWRNASEESLRNELMSACRCAYQFLHKFNVEDVLKETHLPDLSGMTQGTIPALRPDFDLSGENTSYSANYFLCADPRRSEIPDALKASFGEQRTWQEIETGDPSVIVFCRVCQMIAVGALSALLGSSQAAFESLEQQEQNELQRAFQR